jgi:hypothetical protein
MKTHQLVALALSFWASLALGQGAIYESQGTSGPVFSDRPSPGARELVLPPPNVVAPEVLAPAQPTSPPPADDTPVYKKVAIASPANGDTIWSNTGAFDVQVTVAPALRDGDRIGIKLDGTVLPRSFRSGAVSLTEEDWQLAAAENVEHTLQAAVLDAKGAVLAESSVVSFYAHRTARKRRFR